MPKKFAVLGNPIAHSKSPQIHQAFAKQFAISLTYERILTPLDGLATTLQAFQRDGGLGVNITLPFKIEAAQRVHNKTERAIQAGAVNTIKFKQDQWLGDNTDGIGLLRDLIQNLEIQLTHQHILIIGAGGATQGILGPLLAQRPTHIVIANRTLATAEQLVEQFLPLGPCSACSLDNIPQQPFDLIINATSAGVKGEGLQLPVNIINSHTSCYDLAYGPSAQPFLSWAKQHHAKIYCDGLGMLVEQAAEAFYIWHNVMPETQSVIKLLQETSNN